MKHPTPLDIDVSTVFPAPLAGNAVALCVFQDEAPSTRGEAVNLLKSILAENEFKGEVETSSLNYAIGDDGLVRRLLVIGCGAYLELTPSVLRHAAGMAVREACAARIKHLHFLIPRCDNEARMTHAAVEGAVLGSYDSGLYKNNEKDRGRLEQFTIVVTQATDEVSEATRRGRIIAEAANWTRMLSDTPGRDLPPQAFARRAAEMAEEFGLIVESLNVDQIREQGMGGLLGVGKSSDEPPAVIVVRYEP